jgi:hypothetical protein
VTERGVTARAAFIIWPSLLIIGIVLLSLGASVVQRILIFPNPVKLDLEVGSKGPRISRRVVVVVVDGLSVDGSKKMTFINKLRSQSASFIARTETPCYSRTGYTVLGTGTRPEVSGISSNDALGLCPVDSIFTRGSQAGLKLGFVGYPWWLEIFGPCFDYVSTESSLTPDDIALKDDSKGLKTNPIPLGCVCRVLDKAGNFRTVSEYWDSYVQRQRLVEAFGNPEQTSWNEDDRRGQEAARMLREEAPDLLYVHLQTPDAWGHSSASNSSARYLEGCGDADRNIELIARQLDLTRDTLIVTSDHGFTSTVKKAGHGGWEDSASLIPVLMTGAGIKAAVRGQGFQRDVAPTIAVLLGLPFPTHIQGEPFWRALKLDTKAKEAHKRWRSARAQFILAYSQKLQLGLTGELPMAAEEAPFYELVASYQEARRAVKRRAIMVRLAPALLLWLLFVAGLWSSTAKAFYLRWIVTWLAFESVFMAAHFAFLGVFSLSTAASGPLLGRALLVLTLIAAMTALIVSWLIAKPRAYDDFGQGLRALCAGALLKSAFYFVVVGLGPEHFMGHGFWHYGAIVAHIHSFVICSLLPIFVGPFLLLKASKAKINSHKACESESN